MSFDFFLYAFWFCLKGSKIVNLFVDQPIDWLYYCDFSLLYHADWLYCCDFSLLYHAIMVLVDYHVVVILAESKPCVWFLFTNMLLKLVYNCVLVKGYLE